MEMLKGSALEMVSGGDGGGNAAAAQSAADTAAVSANANTAINTCGKGNVKSVSTTGFECK